MTENQRSGENNSNGAPSVQSPPPSAQQEPQQHQPQREVEELQREIARNNDKAEHHQRYLNEFRVEACPLFKQHQCQQHRPFTCFKWHFQNQRRRRPVRKPDGSFNYSPDIYCDKYDENTGICPDGDDCIYLHRVSGDVERKYHLRYYKTAQCVHPTDISGECVKNGAHCAFAHSSHDIRQPMYDQNDTGFSTSVDGEGRDKASFVIEDPQWHSQDHVLSFYKTDQCRKPARLCRQGYACPFYHNSKDRRRPPAVYKYRSTPCPAAKNIDEWLDPEMCEAGDSCQYCHTRTEQQFHPEIYKSTKCNDMLEHGYCPRAVFCAFAHHDSELHAQRNPYVGSSQASPKEQCSPIANSNGFNMSSEQLQFGSPISNGIAPSYSSVLKQRQPIPTGKVYSSTDLISSSYPKAPGYERSPLSVSSAGTFDMRNELGRHRTHSLNMGNFDGIQKSMFINGGMPTIDGNSTSSLCRSDSGFNAVTETSLGTFDELNLDLAPIEEHSNQTFGSIFGNSPMRNEHDPFGNAGYFPPSFPLPTMDGQSNEFEDFNKQRYQEQEKINNYEDALKKCRQLCEFYKNRAERAEIERDLAMQQLNNLHLHGGAASGFMPSVQSLSSPLAINPTTNQTTNGGDAVLEGGIRPSASLQHSPPYNIFGQLLLDSSATENPTFSTSTFQQMMNDCDAGAPACARCGRDRSRSGSDSQSSCPVCST